MKFGNLEVSCKLSKPNISKAQPTIFRAPTNYAYQRSRDERFFATHPCYKKLTYTPSNFQLKDNYDSQRPRTKENRFFSFKDLGEKNERSKPSLVRLKIRGQKPTLKQTAKAPENGWFFQTIRLPFGGGWLSGRCYTC